MNKYVYVEDCADYTQINGVVANSYKEAEEKVMQKFANKLDDPTLNDAYDFDEFAAELYNNYGLSVSCVEDIEEINFN